MAFDTVKEVLSPSTSHSSAREMLSTELCSGITPNILSFVPHDNPVRNFLHSRGGSGEVIWPRSQSHKVVEAGLEARVLILAQIRFHGRERLPGHGGRREVIREDGACEQDLQGQVGFGGEKRDSILARPHYRTKGTESRRQERFREMGRAAGFA